jgi:hypothetical protein
VSVANQLREHLKRVFPGALGLFEDLDSAISLTFLIGKIPEVGGQVTVPGGACGAG